MDLRRLIRNDYLKVLLIDLEAVGDRYLVFTK